MRLLQSEHQAALPECALDQPVRMPGSFNYIGVFLTFRCPYRCSFCINKHGKAGLQAGPELSGSKWRRFFERLEPGEVPITFQGGEPGLHHDFVELVRDVSRERHVDILSNLAFDLRAFVSKVDPAALNRDAPYAPIRVSYHPEQFALETIISRVEFLQTAGFRVGLYGVLHPDQAQEIERARQICLDRGLDFRTKPFLGMHRGELHGRYAYPMACGTEPIGTCECAPSELLIAPDGAIHRCHYYLYNGLAALASVNDPCINLSDDFLPCNSLGSCNPCDVKIKNNRFQQFGHVAVRMRNIRIKNNAKDQHG